jgi:hypothetical protein
MKYEIEKREVHTVKVQVEATSPLEALNKVINGEGTEVENSQEYSDTVDALGIGAANVFQWRVFGPECNKSIGTPAREILS